MATGRFRLLWRAALVTLLAAGPLTAAASVQASPTPSPFPASAAPGRTSPTSEATSATLPSTPTSTPSPSLQPGAGQAIQIWAYYYIWFEPSSWERAKTDTPLLGTYSSDERAIMREHIRLAKGAGIDGFLVSWKGTAKLTERLERLATIARELNFRLGVVYQGLDFARRPIELRQVCSDLTAFADAHAADPVFHLIGPRPVVVWTGTDQIPSADLESCVAPVRTRLTMLASSRSVEEWGRASKIFEGSAYYWSSVDPRKKWYPRQLAEMGAAVHATGDLWVAPAAPGFDARLVGGRSVVPREGGKTLERELQAAVQSSPDAIGLISWNEFTENSHVEPSKTYGTSALRTISRFTGRGSRVPELDSSSPARQSAAAGINGITALIIMAALVGLLLIWSLWRREPAQTQKTARDVGVTSAISPDERRGDGAGPEEV